MDGDTLQRNRAQRLLQAFLYGGAFMFAEMLALGARRSVLPWAAATAMATAVLVWHCRTFRAGSERWRISVFFGIHFLAMASMLERLVPRPHEHDLRVAFTIGVACLAFARLMYVLGAFMLIVRRGPMVRVSRDTPFPGRDLLCGVLVLGGSVLGAASVLGLTGWQMYLSWGLGLAASMAGVEIHLGPSLSGRKLPVYVFILAMFASTLASTLLPSRSLGNELLLLSPFGAGVHLALGVTFRRGLLTTLQSGGT